MYSPDFADQDPRNHMNQPDSLVRYIVGEYVAGAKGNVSISQVLTQEFTTEDEAKTALLAISTFMGEELDVVECDDEGDQTVCFAAVWDEDEKRYVEA